MMSYSTLEEWRALLDRSNVKSKLYVILNGFSNRKEEVVGPKWYSIIFPPTLPEGQPNMYVIRLYVLALTILYNSLCHTLINRI